jgi:tagatose 1,6-diphosphate aldolase
MTLEEHRVEETPGSRKSRVIDNWSVAKIRAMGGEAVKVLAWYRPDADVAVNAHQQNSCARSANNARATTFPMCSNFWYPFFGSAITPRIMWNRRASCRR